jgi:hypothetical protein
MLTFYTIFRESSDPQERKKGLVRQQRQVRRLRKHGQTGHTAFTNLMPR